MIIERSAWLSMRGQLEALFMSAFDRTVVPGIFDWRYYNNGHRELLWSVEMDDVTPVASYSVAPVDLTLDGALFRTVMSMTTMTHPAWRGRGIFPRLAEEVYACARELGFTAVWGFPNANSHLAFADKLAWSNVYEMPTLTLDLTRISPRKLVSNPAVVRDDNFALEYQPPQNDGLIRVHRTREYLAWRYARHPVNRYENFAVAGHGAVSSYVVTKRFADGLDLVDMQCATVDEARVLLAHIAARSCNGELRTIQCWAPLHHWIHSVLERIGFANSCPVTYLGGRALRDYGAPSGWLDYHNWYCQMGDSDVY